MLNESLRSEKSLIAQINDLRLCSSRISAVFVLNTVVSDLSGLRATSDALRYYTKSFSSIQVGFRNKYEIQKRDQCFHLWSSRNSWALMIHLAIMYSSFWREVVSISAVITFNIPLKSCNQVVFFDWCYDHLKLIEICQLIVKSFTASSSDNRQVFVLSEYLYICFQILKGNSNLHDVCIVSFWFFYRHWFIRLM